METSEGSAGAVMCETRDLGTKWPHWNTLMFEGEARVDMRYGQVSLLEEVSSKA